MSALLISFYLLITKCHIKPALVKLSLQALRLTIILLNSEYVKRCKVQNVGLDFKSHNTKANIQNWDTNKQQHK